MSTPLRVYSMLFRCALVAGALAGPIAAAPSSQAETLRAVDMRADASARGARTARTDVRVPPRRRATGTAVGNFGRCTINLSGRCQVTRNITGRRTSSLLRY